MIISGKFSKMVIASSIDVLPGVIFCQQGGLQVGWSSHSVHQFIELLGVAVAIGIAGVLHETLKINSNTKDTKISILLFMAHLYIWRIIVGVGITLN